MVRVMAGGNVSPLPEEATIRSELLTCGNGLPVLSESEIIIFNV